MKKTIVGAAFCLVASLFGFVMKGEAANVDGYTPLDSENPIEFGGTYVTYDGENITLGEKAIYVDGSLDDAVADKYDYVYNDFNDAMTALKNGTEEEPMKVYIAPYVYWIDNPDDEEIRVPESGDIPYGKIIKCDYLSLIGLTEEPENVVLAVNRGQTHGAKGNYTMFYFDGDGTRTENLTMGNYCNVDLEYPLKPELSREKRATAITQAQIALTNGDKIVAINCNFISRLNACPFVGTEGRILFKDCHLECTDDALPGTAVYLNCDIDLYSSKPFYSTSGTGAVFLNCVFNSEVKGTQYLTKAGGTVALIDCEFKTESEDFKVEWTVNPDTALKCNQANVTVNGEHIIVAEDNPYNTVDISGTEAIKAYKIEKDGNVIYNTYNLLQGTDGWDPLDNKPEVAAVDGKYLTYPVALLVSPFKTTEMTDAEGKISYNFQYFRSIAGAEFNDEITYEVEDAIKDNVTITKNDDGTCSYKVTNTGTKPVSGMIYATGEDGYKTGTYITVNPKAMEAPAIDGAPVIIIGKSVDGEIATDVVRVEYKLNTDAEDISVINWYRCSDENGENKILVATSRLDEPEYEYKLTPGDVGYHIMAEITPKIEGAKVGEPVTIVTARPIWEADDLCMEIVTDFQEFPTAIQDEIKKGFWTVGGYKPLDTAEYDWSPTIGSAWKYGEGEGGAVGTGLLQTERGARLLYTPVNGTYGDMTVKLVADPCKSAGQGFGSATAQYMDVYIKFDTETLTGYALRIERTEKFSNGVDFKLIKYVNGETETISEAISASCYNATCTIELAVADGKFTAKATTTHAQSEEQKEAGLLHEVNLAADIETNIFGGSGVMHTGTAGANATMLHQMEIKWDEEDMEILYESAGKSDDSEKSDKEDSGTKNIVTIVIMCVAVVVVAAAVIMLKKRKR